MTNKAVLKLLKIVVKETSDIGEFAKWTTDHNICTSLSEGRRLYAQIKSKEEK